MFEEFYTQSGTLLIPSGSFIDGQPTDNLIPVKYFRSKCASTRNVAEVRSETVFYCKPTDGATIPEPLDADIRFADADGREFDIANAEYVFDPFVQRFETLKLTVVK